MSAPGHDIPCSDEHARCDTYGESGLPEEPRARPGPTTTGPATTTSHAA